jgi:hypothetical protein
MSELGHHFEVMRPYDDALVEMNGADELAKYAVSGPFVSAPPNIKIEEGKRPIVFRCRALPASARESVRDVTVPTRQYRLAFRYGITEIRDIPRPDGGVYEVQYIDRKSPKDAITPERLIKLQELGIGDIDIDFVGAVIMANSFLANGVPLRVQVPASCLHALEAMFRRPPVEQKKDP